MIEVHTIVVSRDSPGVEGYLIEVRLIDKTKGKGRLGYNWDKMLAVTHNELPIAIQKAITAVMKVKLDTKP